MSTAHHGSFRRPMFELALARLGEPRRFIQILAGPRQVGKTTLARQLIKASGLAAHYASADDPSPRDRAWVEAQWELGRLRAAEEREGALLVLDEVQKVSGWSETVKRMWDEDGASGARLKVVILGSAPLLVRRGLSESLAGRFELVRVPHWSFAEMHDAFGWDLDRYLFFGAYPAAVPLISDRDRWSSYILDSLIETTLSRDILLLTRVDKPALLRQLFRLGCDYSGQILSFQKMLGQLQDAGNTTTLAHYLELLSGAGMLAGLQKFSGSRVRRRGSSPKLIALNNALITSGSELSFREARADGGFWGRLVESAVAAHAWSTAQGSLLETHYWRERNREVDLVLSRGRTVVAIEVKSGRAKGTLPGLDAFAKAHTTRRKLLIGGGGIPVAEFLTEPPERWLG